MAVPLDDHDEDEMEMSDDERSTVSAKSGPSATKRFRLDNDSLKVSESVDRLVPSIDS